MQMNKQWMYGDRCRPEFITGMHNFLHVTEANMQSNGFICCPCNVCKNMRQYSTSKTLHVHLLENGFMPNYNCWTKHGERGVYWKTTEKKRIVTTIPYSLKTVIAEWGKTKLKKSPFSMSRFLMTRMTIWVGPFLMRR